MGNRPLWTGLSLLVPLLAVMLTGALAYEEEPTQDRLPPMLFPAQAEPSPPASPGYRQEPLIPPGALLRFEEEAEPEEVRGRPIHYLAIAGGVILVLALIGGLCIRFIRRRKGA